MWEGIWGGRAPIRDKWVGEPRIWGEGRGHLRLRKEMPLPTHPRTGDNSPGLLYSELPEASSPSSKAGATWGRGPNHMPHSPGLGNQGLLPTTYLAVLLQGERDPGRQSQ